MKYLLIFCIGALIGIATEKILDDEIDFEEVVIFENNIPKVGDIYEESFLKNKWDKKERIEIISVDLDTEYVLCNEIFSTDTIWSHHEQYSFWWIKTYYTKVK